jgi:hypothetical protein
MPVSKVRQVGDMKRRRGQTDLNKVVIDYEKPISVCVRVLTNSPHVTLTATLSDFRRKKIAKGVQFSPHQEDIIDQKLKQLREIFGNQDNQLKEKQRKILERGSLIHQENRVISVNYLQYKS